MHRDGHFDYSLFLSRIICLPLTTSTLHNLVLALSFPPLANTRILSFPPDSIIRLSLSLHFFSYFFFILSFCPSLLPLPPLPFSIHRASLHRRLDRTDLLFTCARNNYIQPRFFCHEPRSYELARGGNELSYCKIVPGCNCKRVPGPATRDRIFKRSRIRSVIHFETSYRISLYYRQRYERILFGKILWRISIVNGNNEPVETKQFFYIQVENFWSSQFTRLS